MLCLKSWSMNISLPLASDEKTPSKQERMKNLLYYFLKHSFIKNLLRSRLTHQWETMLVSTRITKLFFIEQDKPALSLKTERWFYVYCEYVGQRTLQIRKETFGIPEETNRFCNIFHRTICWVLCLSITHIKPSL